MADAKETKNDQVEARIIRLAFDGDALRFREFCAKLKAGLPEGTGVALGEALSLINVRRMASLSMRTGAAAATLTSP